jgi:hypothetical protein
MAEKPRDLDHLWPPSSPDWTPYNAVSIRDTLRLVEEGLSPERQDIRARTAQEAQALAYYPSFLCCVTLPPSRVDQPIYERESGPFKLRIVSAFGVPYGIYPRILIAAITTYVTKRKNRGEDTTKVYLGPNFNSAIRAMTGIEYLSGGPRGQLTQFKRQYRATITSRIYWWQNKYSQRMPAAYDIASDWMEAAKVPPAIEDHVLWKANQVETEKRQGGADPIEYNTTLTLGKYFHQDIVNHSPQIDGRIFRELAKGGACLPVDLYVWLTYRANALKSEHRFELTLSWDLLKMQFGATYADMKGFKRRLIPALHRVALYYHGFSFAELNGKMIFTLRRTSVAGPLTQLGTGTGGRDLTDPPAEQTDLFS